MDFGFKDYFCKITKKMVILQENSPLGTLLQAVTGMQLTKIIVKKVSEILMKKRK